MQHMSSSPGLAPSTTAPVPPPKVVEKPQPPERRRGWIWLLVAVIAGGAAAWWLWPSTSQSENASQAGPVSVPTATVTSGQVVQTIRLTGTTGAERFASLLTPQLRGSRGGDLLREAKTFQSPGATYNVRSNATGSRPGSVTGGGSAVSSSGSGSSTGSGGSGSGDGQVASTMGQSGGGSAALRSATSRVARSGSSGASASRSSVSSTTGSAASGDSGLGSTASALMGGGTGGGGTGGTGGGGGGRGTGGGGDYSLVLQSAAKAGVHVKKGETVAEFDRQYMMNRLEDYRASVSQMEASFRKLQAEVEVQKKAHAQDIENAKSDLDKARLDLKTLPVLGEIDSVRTKLAAEEAEARYKQLLGEVRFVEAKYAAQVRNSELEFRQAQLELKRAETNADRMLMKAPIAGLVVMQTTLRGSELAQIQAGDQLYPGIRFMQIVDTSSMVINAVVNQVDAELVRVGAKASIRFDAFPDLQLPATVHALGAMTRPGGMRASYVKDIPVILKFDRLDERVIPDLSVSVDVEIGSERQAAAIVPLASVFHENGSQTPFVFIKKGDGWERRDVQLGLASNLTAVVRAGVQPGEVVAMDRPPTSGRSAGGG